jgi:hypothetical protein
MIATTDRPHLKLWVYPRDGYTGADLSDWYPIVGKHRDSDALARTNFEAALGRLQAVAGHDSPAAKLRGRWYEADEDGDIHPVVSSLSFSNCLVGWSETIFVYKDAPAAVLDEAESILDDLDGYPVLDEEAWSDLEYEEACSFWEGMSVSMRVDYCREAGVSIFAARRPYLPEDPAGRLYELLRRT